MSGMRNMFVPEPPNANNLQIESDKKVCSCVRSDKSQGIVHLNAPLPNWLGFRLQLEVGSIGLTLWLAPRWAETCP